MNRMQTDKKVVLIFIFYEANHLPLLLWSSGGACDEKSMQSVGFYYRQRFDSQKETKSRVMKKAQIK